MKEIINNIAKLIDLKSIITLIVVISYTAMVFTGLIEADYKDIVIMILTYYFSKNTSKETKGDE